MHEIDMIKIAGYLFCATLLFLHSVGWAQQASVDAAQPALDSLSTKAAGADSVSTRVNFKIDSVQSRLNGALNPDLDVQSLSAIVKKNQQKRDSVKAIQQMDSTRASLAHKIDSLKGLNLPHEKYSGKLDSLERLSPANKLGQAESKVDDLERKLNKPVDNVEGAVNDKLDLMNREGGAQANIPGSAALPGASLDAGINIDPPGGPQKPAMPALEKPSIEGLEQAGTLKSKAGDIKSYPGEQLNNIKGVEEITAAQGTLTEVNEITDQAQAYGGEVSNVAKGNLGEVNELPEAAENKAAQYAGVGELQAGVGELGQYQNLNSEESAKKMIKQEATTAIALEAPNHFAGKEDVLKAAIDKMSTLKKKYSDARFLNDSLKTSRNSLRGKPVTERIIPGITFQILKTDLVVIDYNPWIAYRINKRLSVGVGWNERFGIGKKFKFTMANRVYGPRTFADLAIKKGFSVRADVEHMNTYVPPLLNPNRYEGSRTWAWGVFVGFKKRYDFAKGVKGNFQFLYNIYNDNGSSPYQERFNVRFGFEFPGVTKRLFGRG